MLPYCLNVLLIEDNPGDARLIREILKKDGNIGPSYALVHAENLKAATEMCTTELYDVILMDIHLPDSTGLSTLQQLTGLAPQTPIIVLTGIHDEQLALRLSEYGAQDYLIKGDCNAPLLKRAIHYAIGRKRVEEHFKHLATHDPLTGLPNRVLFYDRLSQSLRHAERSRMDTGGKWKSAVLLMDLNGFKFINDHFGHDQGDILLQVAGERLRACLRESDTVARLGGDEFAAIIEGIAGPEDCLLVGRRMIESLNQPLQLSGLETTLDASIGISIFPDHAADVETLIRYADAAMYTAKRQKNKICFHKDAPNE